MIKRRSAIEPSIGHMKMDGRLDRNPLKGPLGDALTPSYVAPATTSACCSRSCGFFAPKSGNGFWRFYINQANR